MAQNLISFREAKKFEIECWDELVTQFPNHQVFHLYGWIKSVEEYTGAKAIFMIAERDGHIVACCPGFLYKFAGLTFFCSPREGWQTDSMGPVFDPETVNTADLISALLRYLQKTHRVKYVELNSRCLDKNEMRRLGFVEEIMPTLRTSLLTNEPEEMFKALDGKARNQVRKAIKVGLIAKCGHTEDFLDQYYSQIKEVFQRRKSTLPFSRHRIEVVFNFLGESDPLLPISIFLPGESECIATGIFLLANNEMYLWGWAHRKEYGSLCPIELLTWTAIEIAIQKGCTALDFGGLGKAKKKYNAVLDEKTNRYMISFIPGLIPMRALARRAYRWQQKFRGKLSLKLNKTQGEDL